jgi:electron transport complex protein RnfD
MNGLVAASAPPYLRDRLDTRAIMYAVVVALLPAAAGAYYFFGPRALIVIGLASVTAVLTEAFCQKAIRRKVTVTDGSAFLTGMLVGLNLPPGVPYWLPAVGSAFAIAVAKVPFGGLGYNIVNPALAARAFLMASWPVRMAGAWVEPARGTLSGISGVDAVTGATPLSVFRMMRGIITDPSSTPQDIAVAVSNLKSLCSPGSLENLFFGNVGGSIGETSVLLLAIGAVYLLARRIICWRIPSAYLVTVAVLTWAFGGIGLFKGSPVFHLMSGGLMLGAFFMATDPVTAPVTRRGKLIFGFGCGLITSIIRLTGGYPEGVCYSILLMNLTVPWLDRLTRPRIFGHAAGGA